MRLHLKYVLCFIRHKTKNTFVDELFCNVFIFPGLQLTVVCRYMPASPDYFTHVQREIKPHMRFTVTEWMFEICMDERLQFSSSPEVFALAVNFLDRFLSLCW